MRRAPYHTIAYSTREVNSGSIGAVGYSIGQRTGLRRKIHEAVAGNNSTVAVRYTVYCHTRVSQYPYQ